MKIDEIRIYAEVLEQGLDFKNYIEKVGTHCRIKNIYTKKIHGEFKPNDSFIDRIRKVKDVDVLITAIVAGREYPLLMVEYSTAVPTDDHKMQRSDVYYWGAKLKVPMLKISPISKGMGQDFGGGSNITDEFEQKVSYGCGAVLYQIKWQSDARTDNLEVDEDHLSCIKHSKQITEKISFVLRAFTRCSTYELFFDECRKDISANGGSISKPTLKECKTIIKDSSRFSWSGDALKVKINRFGHAMDPDRGVLYFANMMVGAEKTIAEIQVNRSDDYNSRGGYSSLFDATSSEGVLRKYVETIIKTKKNVFSEGDALFVFQKALNIDGKLNIRKINGKSGEYVINNDDLLRFLKSNQGITSKCIFFLATRLVLTDKDRDKICGISWDANVITKYLESTRVTNFGATSIKPLTTEDAQEDIITFASVELYRRIDCSLLAVSYPGAQGDKCILEGSGRRVLRTYVDIIAYDKNSSGINVYLEECKSEFSKSGQDVVKLNEIKHSRSKQQGLKDLINKNVGKYAIGKVSTSVGAKATAKPPYFDVDYIFMFNVAEDKDKTKIDYNVAVIDLSLSAKFKPLQMGSRLSGSLMYDKIYVVA